MVGEGFDLIIRTEEMDKKESKIRALVAEMAAQLKSEPLDALLDSFTAFSNLVSPNAKRTTLHGNCKVASGLKEGNALEASKISYLICIVILRRALKSNPIGRSGTSKVRIS